MRVPFLNLTKQNALLAEEFKEALVDGIHSQLVHGVRHREFEKAWASYCGFAECVGVGNGYDALRLLLNSWHVSGRDVVVASNTHVSTWLAVVAAGGRLVVAEPDPDTYVLTPATVADVMRKDAIVLATNLYGNDVDVEGIRALGASAVFLDACQAHGLKSLKDADGAAFSFYPTKNLGALGDGGAICTSTALAILPLHERNYGGVKQNVHEIIGCNSRLDELQAAFLLRKLPMLEEYNARRKIIADRYREGFADIVTVQKPITSVNHQFVVLHEDRDTFRQRLFGRYIETMVHYPTPPHLQLAFKYFGFENGSFPVAERLAKTCVSLPIGPELTNDQVDYVIDCVRWCA